MSTEFAAFMEALESEACLEGPEAVAQLVALRDHFRSLRATAHVRGRNTRSYDGGDDEHG